MNRFKKELRKKGIKLACDFEFLPFEVSRSNNYRLDKSTHDN